MADDLAREMEKFHLTEEEETVIDGDTNDEAELEAKVSLMLVGKLLTNRPFNFEAMKRTLKSVWRLKDGIAIRMVETNFFIFQFFLASDKEKVIRGRPWFFDNQLLILLEIDGKEQVSEVSFNKSPCWIRVYDLPFVKRSVAFAKSVGDSMGGFLELDESDPLGLDNFLRLKIMMDITKPLRRGFKVAVGGGLSKWVDVKYERVGDFCYLCGKLGHVDKDCENYNVEDGSTKELVYKYGLWLRASPLRRNKMSKEDFINEKQMSQKLKEKKVVVGSILEEATVTKLGPPSLARRALFREDDGKDDFEDGGGNEATDREMFSSKSGWLHDKDGEFSHEVIRSGDAISEGSSMPCPNSSRKWVRVPRNTGNETDHSAIQVPSSGDGCLLSKKRPMPENGDEGRKKACTSLMDTDDVIEVAGNGGTLPREGQ